MVANTSAGPVHSELHVLTKTQRCSVQSQDPDASHCSCSSLDTLCKAVGAIASVSPMKALKDRFGLRYTYCGCPIPGNAIGQCLSKLVTHLATSYSGSTSSQQALAPPAGTVSSRTSTHSSDHDAVVHLVKHGYPFHESRRAARAEVAERRQKRDDKASKKKKDEDTA